MTELRYFIRWGSNRMRSPDPFSHGIPADEARSLHDSRGIYTAVALREGGPFAVIASNNGFFGVNFLDQEYRDYLIYDFREIQTGRLFLEQATYRHFRNGASSASSQQLYSFRPDGAHSGKVTDFDRKTSKFSDPRVIDVTRNWEAYPEFGRYDGLLRVER